MTDNIPRLFTALAEWLACMVYIGQYQHRFSGKRLGAVAVGGLVVQVLWLEMTNPLPVPFWIPAMMMAVALMFLLIYLCCTMDPISAGYCAIRAFVLAEFAASLEWQIDYFISWYITPHWLLSCGIMVVVYGAVFALMYHIERRANQGFHTLNIRPGEFVSSAVMGLAAFFISNLSFVSSNTPFSSLYVRDIYNVRTLVGLAGVVILYAYHVQRCRLYTTRELDSIKNILQNQYVQYRQSRESIELINRKYHDLKHQIAILRAEENPQQRAAFLDKMEAEIQHYEAQNKTGNPVLDTVLTGKSLYCAKHQIKLTCVADGTALDFMDVTDICTIFGNLLDNAIEYELTIPDKEQRLIHLEVSTKKGFLLIRCENFFQGTLICQDGLPRTTKQDTDYHGYGLKSIRYTAKKYGGNLTVDGDNGWFVATLLVPLPPSK